VPRREAITQSLIALRRSQRLVADLDDLLRTVPWPFPLQRRDAVVEDWRWALEQSRELVDRLRGYLASMEDTIRHAAVMDDPPEAVLLRAPVDERRKAAEEAIRTLRERLPW